MNNEELASYYAGMQLFVGVINNYIDFENIDQPIQSSMKKVVDVAIPLLKDEKYKGFLTRNKLVDNTNFFQIYAEDVISNFLTLDGVINNATPLGSERMYVSV